ncbi:MAG: hypothetical protein AAB463_00105 [Patescibacteria group bacterium]
MKRIIIVAGVLLIVVLGVWLFTRGGEGAPTETTEPTVSGTPNVSEGGLYRDAGGLYTASIPTGWYPHEITAEHVLFTQKQQFEVLEGTEGYAYGDQFSVSVAPIGRSSGARNEQEWFTGNGMVLGNEFLKERRSVRVGPLTMTRVVMSANVADGDTLTYVYFTNDGRVVTLGHYPYKPDSSATRDFEAFVQSFTLVGSGK